MATIPAHSTAAAITAYQRLVSPYKGFCCADRTLNGGLSCSQAIKRLVLRHGLLASWPYVRARFDSCRAAYGALMEQAKDKGKTKNTETEYGECPLFTKEFWKKNKTVLLCCNIASPCACWPY
jgi:putative component of membrane protein insertase Oxa1/YidC/SpoIIIJ protein YidD